MLHIMYVGDVRRHNGNTTGNVTYIDHVTRNGTVMHRTMLHMWTMLHILAILQMRVMLHIRAMPHMRAILIHVGIILHMPAMLHTGAMLHMPPFMIALN